MNKDNTLSNVQKYYGTDLSSNADLKTSACCNIETFPRYQKDVLAKILPEITSKYYGCGSPIPQGIDGVTILDLGCGTGQDVYTLVKLARGTSKIIGVDITHEQLDVAKEYQEAQMEIFGLDPKLVDFKLGQIEDLKSLGIEDDSIDIVVSNCVLNLAHDKEEVFKEILRVLKPGGELYFADVYSDRRIPMDLQKDSVLYGECLSGALYDQDFRRLLLRNGINDFREVKRSKIDLTDPDIINKIGHINFTSITYRVFNIELEDKCEEYGQMVRYLGQHSHMPHQFELDNHHLFQTMKWESVCSNTYDMLKKTRLAKYFEFQGDTSIHYGIFGGCYEDDSASADSGSCC